MPKIQFTEEFRQEAIIKYGKPEIVNQVAVLAAQPAGLDLY